MAEILSQSQIDALLNAARSGEPLGEPENTPEEKKYRKYDFKSPRKFTKDRLKMLDGIFENYARSINSRINGLMRSTCEIELESAEEQRYYEFSNALTEGDVLTLAYVRYKHLDKQEDSPILFHVTMPLMLSMIDRMLGGEGDTDDDLDPDYTLTDLELKVYESIMEDMAGNMGESWGTYIGLDVEYGRVETNPTLVQPLGLDEIVVIMELTIKFPNCNGRMSVCLPGMMLTNLFGEINRLNASPINSDKGTYQAILDSIQDTDIELVGEMCRTQLKLVDVYHLNEGDVIDLHRPKDSPVYINIGGKRWFEGKMGVYNKNMAIKIGKTYGEDQGRIDEENDR